MKKSLAEYMEDEDKPAKAEKSSDESKMGFGDMSQLYLFEKAFHPAYDDECTPTERMMKQMLAVTAFIKSIK